MRDVLIGQTDYTVLVRMASTTGAPVTALAHTDIDIAYSRVETDNDVTTSDVAPASLSALTDAHSDWGWKEVSSGDHPGLYRLDIADAVFASGAWEAVVTITDASGTDFYATDIGFRLVNVDPQASVYPANVTQLLGTAWLTPGTAGTPDVNAKLWNGLATVELPLVPTTAGRKLDVSAGGEAGIDWANVGSPTTTVGLSGTTVKTATDVETDTQDIQTQIGVAGAGLTAADDAVIAAIGALSIPTTGQIFTAVWTTALTEAYRATGAAGTAAQLMHEIIAHLGDSSISGTTKTINNRAGSAAKTYTLDSAVTPTSIAEAT